MNRLIFLLSFLGIASVASYSAFSSSLATQAVENLPHIHIQIASVHQSVAVASNLAARSAGLRGSSVSALLFTWSSPLRPVFNMLQCNFPLYLVPIGRSGRILSVRRMEPGSALYPVHSDVRCVLELRLNAPLAQVVRPGEIVHLPAGYCS